MSSRLIRRAIGLGAILALPAMGFAQEQVLNGTVRDSSGAVLPGVTITATNTDNGNTFETVTDGRGAYRLSVRPGPYSIRAALSGFQTVVQTGLTLLVGQETRVDISMAVSTVEETVEVTGEAPLVNVNESMVGGNIDPKQMTEVPILGRDWKSLALLAPGNRTTEIGGDPVQWTREDNVDFNMNLDGQQVSNALGVGGQPRYSRESIAEFEFISNRFDATQGRSPAAMVNAITKSGTNTLKGEMSGYFLNNDWGAKDHVLNEKVPYKNQQFSGALGGPIVKDRLHFFGNFEYQRTPRTTTANTPYPSFNISLTGTNSVKMGGGRVDYEISPSNRLMVRGDGAKSWQPFSDLGSDHPAGTSSTDETSYSVWGTLNSVLSNRALNQIKFGYSKFGFHQETLTHWSNSWQANNGLTTGHPRIRFQGFSIAGSTFQPRTWAQRVLTFRDDFTYSYEAKGRHDLKTGGEYLHSASLSTNCNQCMGLIFARGGPVPSNIEQLFPDPFNVDTWDLAAISPITQRYNIGVGTFDFPDTMHKFGAWVQDDWQISEKMTLNLGLRYDLIWNAFGQKWSVPNWVAADRPQDTNNIQPRLGFAYSLDDKTVLRGGAGLYYADIPAAGLFWAQFPTKAALITVRNDGRADFAANPFNGPRPTYEEALGLFCNANNVPGCLLQSYEELPPPAAYAHVPQKWQFSVGMQRRVGSSSAFTADYVYARGTNEKLLQPNMNLTYDPDDEVPFGPHANYPFSDTAHRVDPTYGVVGVDPFLGWSNYHALQTSFTKRFSNNYQFGATYTLSWLYTGEGNPISGSQLVTLTVPKDIGGDYSLAQTDQRHRLVLNGVWEVGGGFQLSGVYFYGSGARFSRIYGEDLRDIGESFEAFGLRLRQDGSLVPRNALVGDPIHRVDVRLQQRIPLGSRLKLDGIFELYNLFDHANYGGYVNDELSPQFGEPTYSSNIAFTPRAIQLGFRLQF